MLNQALDAWTELLGGDLIPAIVHTFTETVGQFFFIFFMAIIFVPMYIKSQDVYLPLTVWLLLAVVFRILLPIEFATIQYVFIAISIAGLLVRAYHGRSV